MKSAVILEHAAVASALGDLNQTVCGLMNAQCGIAEGPCFGVPVGCAPFCDTSYRDLRTCARALVAGLQPGRPGSAPTLLLYAAAKGDLRGMDMLIEGRGGEALRSALLSEQASVVRAAIAADVGRTIVVSNACASGLIALEVACELLAAGEFGDAVIVGYDSLSRFVATGFRALGALSSAKARPFDRHRDGLTLGEGAAVVLLKSREPKPGDLLIAGVGSSNDANHRTGPSRTGEGLYRAAAAALAAASVEPADIGAVKCHGTATVYNDAMEAKAIARLFGDAIPPCVSFKGALGHTSGGGSLLEAVVAGECLKRRLLPPTVGYREHGVDEPIAVSASSQGITAPAILCLSAGFGGVNAAAVIREHTV
jgi:3-oxoacyl-(acyl-carrier-protein) synthase